MYLTTGSIQQLANISLMVTIDIHVDDACCRVAFGINFDTKFDMPHEAIK